MAQNFVTKIAELPIASDRAKADIAGNVIADTYATKTESGKVSTSEGATPDYLGNVLKAGDGISLIESDGAITAKAKIRIITWRSTVSFSELYNDLVNGDTVLFMKYNSQLYPMAYFDKSSITFFGHDVSSASQSKVRILKMNSDNSWSEGALFFVPRGSTMGRSFQGCSSYDNKTLTAKSTDYWTGYWVPIVSIPIRRFLISLSIYDRTSAYNTSYCLDLMGIDKDCLTVSYSCLNPENDCLRIWKDSSNWYIGFDGSALSKDEHDFSYIATSPYIFYTEVVSNETRVDPSTVSISGIRLQKPPANVTPDWDQTAPSTTSDETELNPEQGSTELS